ncbi:hypothetical protein B0H67DRAFT_551491 [Lasiosphaeris hirsuta]|uniref:Uncharacterized protein n=1 Tax=Lasiosphaeris hirsuta TaxID=260670 RepID=A0AA40E6R3_9PEZI|nr:hypothetical protein B0H67DRAFT_551491 [Lasiosphaeris hirsuta]
MHSQDQASNQHTPQHHATMPILNTLTSLAHRTKTAAVVVATGTGTALRTIQRLHEDDMLKRTAVDRIVTLACDFYELTHPPSFGAGPTRRQLEAGHPPPGRRERSEVEEGELVGWVEVDYDGGDHDAEDYKAGREIHEVDLLFTPTCAGLFPDAVSLSEKERGKEEVWREEGAEERIEQVLEKLRSQFAPGREDLVALRSGSGGERKGHPTPSLAHGESFRSLGSIHGRLAGYLR